MAGDGSGDLLEVLVHGDVLGADLLGVLQGRDGGKSVVVLDGELARRCTSKMGALT